MSDPALVGVLRADGTFAARHVHWADDPYRTLAKLRQIWASTSARDIAATVHALLGHDWHSLCPSCTCRKLPPNTRKVTGVGHAASHDLPVTQGAVASAERTGYTEWMYLLDESTEQVVVYEPTLHGRWLPQSRHALDPEHDQRVLGCGGTPATGHRWEPARVALPHLRDIDTPAATTYDAEVCAGAHPYTFTIARFTAAVADQIAADTAVTAAPDVTTPVLLRRRHGGYDLQITDATVRVRPDEDGMLLIGPYLLFWQRVDLPPAEPYRAHDRVVLEHTGDPHTRLEPGAEGTVLHYLPDQRTVHVRWDDGSTLGILLDAGDRIRIIHRPPTTDMPGGPR
jgi:hypothetical protein